MNFFDKITYSVDRKCLSAAPGGLTVIFILRRRKCLGFVNPKRAFRDFSSFPSPSLGTHLRPKPRLRSTGSRGFPGKCVPNLGLGNEKKMPLCRSRRIDKSARNAWDLSIPSGHFGKIFPRSQAGAWEREKKAPGRSRRIDKSAGNAWDLSIPGEHFGKIFYLLILGNLQEKENRIIENHARFFKKIFQISRSEGTPA